MYQGKVKKTRKKSARKTVRKESGKSGAWP